MAAWDETVLKAQPGANFMQSSTWARFREQSPWRARTKRMQTTDGDGFDYQSFSRRAPGLGVLEHAPRLTGMTDALVPEFTEHVRASADRRAVAFKLELYQSHDEALLQTFLGHGWQHARPTQYRNAVAVDLRGTAADIQQQFKKRARYEVRVAERMGVVVERVPLTAENMALMLSLVGEVKQRSGAFFRKEEYLKSCWRTFDRSGNGRLYFASHEQQIICGAFITTFGKQAWYKDGGSLRVKTEMMAPRYMHWRIMTDLQSEGFERYELGNIPSPEVASTSSMAGLFTFKTGFSQVTEQYLPALELP
ncbi:lipid II:glycine glycyltransferase FemX [Leifsonia poae]|uniref:lipid II:glycine glycyltransferase FemX n=1 Tax=Leifsonia poae TaxID=110933 RepID=UPI003D66E108